MNQSALHTAITPVAVLNYCMLTATLHSFLTVLSALNLRNHHAMIRKPIYIDYFVSENSLIVVLFQVKKAHLIFLVLNSMLLIRGLRLKCLHFVRYSVTQPRICSPPTGIWIFYFYYFRGLG
jgi:hypothetical protein